MDNTTALILGGVWGGACLANYSWGSIMDGPDDVILNVINFPAAIPTHINLPTYGTYQIASTLIGAVTLFAINKYLLKGGK